MADIAMWVYEEFERREQGDYELIKREARELGSMAISAISSKVEEEISSLREMVEDKLEGLEPRSPFALAAFDGMFSS